MLADILILSTLAGAATGIGGAIAVIKRPGKRLFDFLMGFAGGVMLSLSFTELLAEAINLGGLTLSIIGFSVGALLIFLIDSVLPHIHFFVKERGILDWKVFRGVFDWRLFRIGTLVAIGISIHNIPEGMAVGAGYINAPALGLVVAIGIALHNIPEGVATALPLYASGFSRNKSFLISLFSGFVEPIGALIAYLFLSGFPLLTPAMLAFAAGVMIFITLDELLPEICAIKERHQFQHFMSLGILVGIISVMILSKLFRV